MSDNAVVSSSTDLDRRSRSDSEGSQITVNHFTIIGVLGVGSMGKVRTQDVWEGGSLVAVPYHARAHG